MLCEKLSLRRHKTCLLASDKYSTADQPMNTTKIQLGEPMNFIRVTYRSRNDSVAPPRATPAWVAGHRSVAPGAHCTAGREGTCQIGESFPSDCAKQSADVCFSSAASLVSESSLQLVLSESLHRLTLSERDSQLLLLTVGGRGLVNLASFRNFLKFLGVVYLTA